LPGDICMTDETFLIDTNVVMYAAGRKHPYKSACADIISGIADGSFHRNVGVPVTDTEVFQEILYRYALVGKWQTGIVICQHLLELGLEILSVSSDEVPTMIALAEAYKDKAVSPRDLVHVSVMTSRGIKKIVSVDSHFDLIHEVIRVDPQELHLPVGPS
jgi:predicted nucleic acid-binding protein